MTGRLQAAAAAAAVAVLLPLSEWADSAQFTSRVNAVEVYATVLDAAGAPLKGLQASDFIVLENGREQQISTFAAGEFPLSVAVAIDRSFSMAGRQLAAARSAARVFLGELQPADDAMVLAIGSSVEVLAPLSTDRAAQLAAVDRVDAFGTTGLYDAIVAAIAAIQEARGRRALVLLSDGSDRYSSTPAQEALVRARKSDVLVYPIAFGRRRPPLFAELASVTGGRSFHVEDARQLPGTLRQIAAELRHQYLLGYTPPGAQDAPGWRSIEVTVRRPGLTVRARDGYLVP